MMQTDLQTYIHISKYARWNSEEKRRETWPETVKRYVDFFRARHPDLTDIFDNMELDIVSLFVMPSMRCMMTAGLALERDNIVGYNCSGIAVNHQRVFDEIFYILMGGSGVGFSVERQYINQMPEVAESFHDTDTVIMVKDSRAGWAKALKELISLLYQGDIPKWDLSRVRPAGTRLKTMGGRASGPEPLNALFVRLVNVFRKAQGRKLNSIECHDIICHIAMAVIVGSVRRAAGISFSNLTDDRMRRAKSGQWWIIDPQRALANNSVMYTEKPDLESFSKEWREMYKSKSGERGMVNQEALKRKAIECGREHEGSYVLNPCGEAILRDNGGLCNLSTCIIKSTDTFNDILLKIKMAVIIGTFQSTLTNFKYVRNIWKQNAEEERLLGVSMTGITDHPFLSSLKRQAKTVSEWTGKSDIDSLPKILEYFRAYAKEVNAAWAKNLGINPAGQITLVKPEGTTSLLCGTASGIHPRFSKYYIRRVRQDKKDPLTDLMISQGVEYVDEGEKMAFTFYDKASEGSLIQEDMSAMDQLQLWKCYADHFCDGNPSQSVYYTDDEYFEIADWVWKNWDSIGGLSFFPIDDNVYINPPLEKITRDKYLEGVAKFPKIDWTRLADFEKEDNSVQQVAVACSGGNCEIQ